jgi:hypothetical protein
MRKNHRWFFLKISSFTISEKRKSLPYNSYS